MAAFLQIFVIAFIYGLGGALQPGPLLAFTINSSAKRGSSVGWLVVLGHGIVESSLVILIFLGAAAFLKDPTAVRLLGGAGALLLALLALTMLRGSRTLSLSTILSGTAAPSRVEHPVLGGILLTALNPTFAPWWAGIGFAMVMEYGTTWANVAVFYAGHITADFLWYVLISNVVSRGRRFISDRTYRVFILCCALFMLFFAAKFALSALSGPSN